MTRPKCIVYSYLAKICIVFSVLYISANADVAKIEGTTNVEDTELYGGALAANGFGGRTLLRIDALDPTTPRSVIRAKNLSSVIPAGSTITNAVCSIFVYDSRGVATDVGAFRVFKPWIEGTDNNVTCTNGCNWTDWDCASGFGWTTAGCNSADDGGSDNSGDGTGADRKATAESTVNIPGNPTGDNTWQTFTISNALAQGWLDGTIAERGVILLQTGAEDADFLIRSTESASGNPPFFVFTYTPPASGGQKVWIRK